MAWWRWGAGRHPKPAPAPSRETRVRGSTGRSIERCFAGYFGTHLPVRRSQRAGRQPGSTDRRREVGQSCTGSWDRVGRHPSVAFHLMKCIGPRTCRFVINGTTVTTASLGLIGRGKRCVVSNQDDRPDLVCLRAYDWLKVREVDIARLQSTVLVRPSPAR